MKTLKTKPEEPSKYKETGRIILVIAISFCLIVILVGYILTKDIALFATDTIIGTALITITTYYFKK